MNKKRIVRLIFAAEIFLFAMFYCYGAHGLYAVNQLKQENKALEMQMAQVKQEIALLEDEINTWSTDHFYKEKLARERLNMLRDDEEVYLL